MYLWPIFSLSFIITLRFFLSVQLPSQGDPSLCSWMGLFQLWISMLLILFLKVSLILNARYSTETVTLVVSQQPIKFLLSVNLPKVFYASSRRLLMMMMIIVLGPGINLWGTLLFTEHQEAVLSSVAVQLIFSSWLILMCFKGKYCCGLILRCFRNTLHY